MSEELHPVRPQRPSDHNRFSVLCEKKASTLLVSLVPPPGLGSPIALQEFPVSKEGQGAMQRFYILAEAVALFVTLGGDLAPVEQALSAFTPFRGRWKLDGFPIRCFEGTGRAYVIQLTADEQQYWVWSEGAEAGELPRVEMHEFLNERSGVDPALNLDDCPTTPYEDE